MAKIVYIAHQLGGNINENVSNILKICRDVHTEDIIPIAPYLISVQYLNDDISEERGLGILSNKEYFKRKVMDETWICGPKISNGMVEEIKLSREYDIPVVCHNLKLENDLKSIIEKCNDF